MTTTANSKWTDNARFLARSGDSPTYVIDDSDENGTRPDCSFQSFAYQLTLHLMILKFS